jgi:hypothetical protein
METPADFSAGAPNLFRQRPTLPPTQSGSTIGAEGLNFRVRNGIGCDPLALATGKSDSPPIKIGAECFRVFNWRLRSRVRTMIAIRYRMRPR